MSGPRPHPRSRAGAIVAVALAALLAACAGPGGHDAPRPIEEGIELRYRVDGARGDDAVLETFAVLARRCAAVGVERFRLSVYGEGRFGVILDAAEAPKLDRLKRVLGMQGDLRLQVVALEQDAGTIRAILERKEAGEYDPAAAPFDVVAAPAGGGEGASLLVENGDGLFRGLVDDAYVSKGDLLEPAVGFTWAPTAAGRFGDFTERHVGRSLAIIVDGEALSSPVIQERIGASGRITGRFGEEEVEDLALVLKAGRLPSIPVLESEKTFGPAGDAPPSEAGAKESKE